MASKDIKAGGAYVALSTKDTGLSAGLGRAKDMLGGFAKSVAIVGAAGAGAAVAGLAVAVKQAVSMGSALKDASDRTGLAASNLSELKYAAEQSGTSLEDVEKGLRNMAKNGMDPKKFDEVAASIAAIEDPGKRAQKAIEVWGKSGAQLLPMIGNLAALRQEARDTGNVMGDDMAASAEHLGDLFVSLWGTIQNGVAAVGALAVPFLEVAIPAIQSFVQVAISAIPTVVAIIEYGMSAIGEAIANVWNYIGGRTGGIMAFMVDSVSNAISSVTFAFTNWKLLAQVALVSAELSVVRFANQVAYFFGTFVPGWLSWFGDHWREVFTDMMNVTATIASNIWTNLSNLWDAIVGLFNGEGFEFTWTPLTKGFESAIKELPKIAEREMGPLEKDLQDRLNGLANDMVQKFDANHAAVKSKVEAFAAKFSGVTGGGRQAVKKAAAEGLPDSNKQKIFGSFSASALAAGGSPIETPMVKEQREAKRILLQQLKEAQLTRAFMSQWGLT